MLKSVLFSSFPFYLEAQLLHFSVGIFKFDGRSFGTLSIKGGRDCQCRFDQMFMGNAGEMFFQLRNGIQAGRTEFYGCTHAFNRNRFRDFP